MRFHTLLVLSVIALASIAAPSVSSKHVTVTVDVDLPHHSHSDSAGHSNGAAAMMALPEIPIGEHEMSHELDKDGHEISEPSGRFTGNRQSLSKLRQEIIDRHNRNAGKEILGGHPEKGPDRPVNEHQIERIRTEKATVKEIEREYQNELKALRDVQTMEARDAKYRKMTPREAEKAFVVDELTDVNTVMEQKKKVEEDRVKQFQARVDSNNPNRINDQMSPEEIVEAIHLRSIRQTYTDHDLNVDEGKEQRLASELPDYKAQQEVQKSLKQKKDRLQAMIDPIAHIELVKVWGSSNGQWQAAQFVFPEEVDHTLQSYQANRRFEPVTAANKKEAMAYVARTIQSTENGIQSQRIGGIKSNIQKIEKVVNDNKVKIKEIQNPKSELNQVW